MEMNISIHISSWTIIACTFAPVIGAACVALLNRRRLLVVSRQFLQLHSTKKHGEIRLPDHVQNS